MEGKQLLTFVFLSFYLLYTFHIHLTSSQALKSYGESCDADCDERQLLTCSQNSSICECMHPTSMVYDQPQQRCVGRAGYPCLRYGSDFHCVPHASCDRTSRNCLCDKGYFSGENGTSCSLLAKYGDACSAKRPCDRGSGMACMEKSGGSGRSKRSCQCMYPSDQFYDPGQNACISYAGGNCSFSGACIRNADCSEDIYELRRGENLHGKSYTYNVTVGRRCGCREGTTPSKDRHCLRTYLQPCDPQAEKGDGGCNTEENLKCFDSSVCLCTNPLSQIYDRAVGRNGKCVNLVGAKCISPRRTRRKEMEGGGDVGGDDATQADKSADDAGSEVVCTSNAHCSNQTGVCECKPGYSPSPFSTCLKDYGTDCGSRDGEGSSSSPCNIYRGLSCHHSSGTCGCIDEDTLKYDKDLKSCLSMEVGGPCGTFEYSDRTGFALGGGGDDIRGGVLMMMMGNHNREMMMVARGNGNPAVISGVGNGNANHNQSQTQSQSASSSPVLPGNGNINQREKLLQSFPVSRIHIKCGDQLECVNLFGETVIMKNGRRDVADNDIFQGFCRKRL